MKNSRVLRPRGHSSSSLDEMAVCGQDSATCAEVLDSVVFFALGAKKHHKSGSKAWKNASGLLSLMKEQPNGDSVVGQPAPFNYDDCVNDALSDADETEKTMRSTLSTFYLQLIFVNSFSESFFMSHFEWLKRSDKNAKDYGFLVVHMALHTYIMRRDLVRLQDTWASGIEFQKYCKVLGMCLALAR